MFEQPRYNGIDISGLKPGDVITNKQLVNLHKINQVPGTECPFWAFVLKFKTDVVNLLFQLGRPAAVSQKRGDLHVLQSNAMSEYCSATHESLLRRLAKYSVLMKYVDTTSMTEGELSNHERRVLVMDEQMSALISARNKLGLSNGAILSNAQLKQGNELPEM